MALPVALWRFDTVAFAAFIGAHCCALRRTADGLAFGAIAVSADCGGTDHCASWRAAAGLAVVLARSADGLALGWCTDRLADLITGR